MLFKGQINIYVCAIGLFFFVCCNPSKSRLTREYKQVYIEEFKLTYLKSFLLKSYNNSNAIREIINNDHSGFTEPVLTLNDLSFIDSLSELDHLNLKMDSANGFKRAEGSQGKRPLGQIIKRLDSKWLDSLARVRYRINGRRSVFM